MRLFIKILKILLLGNLILLSKIKWNQKEWYFFYNTVIKHWSFIQFKNRDINWCLFWDFAKTWRRYFLKITLKTFDVLVWSIFCYCQYFDVENLNCKSDMLKIWNVYFHLTFDSNIVVWPIRWLTYWLKNNWRNR